MAAVVPQMRNWRNALSQKETIENPIPGVGVRVNERDSYLPVVDDWPVAAAGVVVGVGAPSTTRDQRDGGRCAALEYGTSEPKWDITRNGRWQRRR